MVAMTVRGESELSLRTKTFGPPVARLRASHAPPFAMAGVGGDVTTARPAAQGAFMLASRTIGMELSARTTAKRSSVAVGKFPSIKGKLRLPSSEKPPNSSKLVTGLGEVSGIACPNRSRSVVFASVDRQRPLDVPGVPESVGFGFPAMSTRALLSMAVRVKEP